MLLSKGPAPRSCAGSSQSSCRARPLVAPSSSRSRSARPQASSKGGAEHEEAHASPSTSSPKQPRVTESPTSGVLNIPYESDKKPQDVVKTTGLHRAPLTGGVKTATTRSGCVANQSWMEGITNHAAPNAAVALDTDPASSSNRFDLPTPPVAVRNLVEIARFGHLCTTMSGMHHRRAGYPFGTLIDVAADGGGYPIFCLSPLAIHSRNLMEDPRCSLVVQMPGWTGLANARVTIFGDVYQLPADMQDQAREIFHAKHASERKERWVSGNFVYYRMNKIVDIYFVGGFGTVQWIDPQEYLSSTPDAIVQEQPTKVLQVLNELFAADLKAMLSTPEKPIADLVVACIDAAGVDIRIKRGNEFNVERIGFDSHITTLGEAVAALKKVVVVRAV